MTPSLRTLRKIADAFSVSIPELLEPPARGESVHISRKGASPGVLRGLVGALDGPRSRIVRGEDSSGHRHAGRPSRGRVHGQVRIKQGQMKLFHVLQGTVALRHDGKNYRMSEGDSALVDGSAPHSWDNVGRRRARVLWIILG
jgi:hypothetical protein